MNSVHKKLRVVNEVWMLLSCLSKSMLAIVAVMNSIILVSLLLVIRNFVTRKANQNSILISFPKYCGKRWAITSCVISLLEKCQPGPVCGAPTIDMLLASAPSAETHSLSCLLAGQSGHNRHSESVMRRPVNFAQYVKVV